MKSSRGKSRGYFEWSDATIYRCAVVGEALGGEVLVVEITGFVVVILQSQMIEEVSIVEGAACGKASDVSDEFSQ